MANKTRVSGFERAFNPRTISIVGVSRTDKKQHPGGTGLGFFRRLRQLGFKGRIYPVNPKAEEIEGVRSYPSVVSVPEPLDLAIITVPAKSVPQVLKDCIAAGVLNVHICTSGFSETGEEEGKRLEETAREIALDGGLRVIGPNSMGLQVPSAKISTFDDMPLVNGPVSFVSQSGGHAGAFLRFGPDQGIGFSKIISYGNALTLDAPDFLEYLGSDPETRVICLYIEGIRDGRKLIRLVREINTRKPIIIWKGGLTDSGARAAASHTGSLAGDSQVWDAFFKQTGAIRVSSIEEMAEVVSALLYLRPSVSRGVAVLGGGGGNNVATGDICAQEGIELPLLSSETQTKLNDFISLVNQSVTNPLDAPSLFTDASHLRQAIELLTADPGVHVIILNLNVGLFGITPPKLMRQVRKCICDFARETPGGKPIVAAIPHQGTGVAWEFAQKLIKEGIPSYRSLRRACRALNRFTRYNEYVSQVSGTCTDDLQDE
ncbi:acetate--CoA ligase family protein [Chloroflexota bacterium]